MKQSKRIWARLLIFVLMAALAAFPLIGCSGSDGDDGKDGAAGPPGQDGQDGQDGVSAVGDVTPLNLKLDLTQTVSYNPANGQVSIHFFLTDEDDNGVDVFTDAYELRVYAAELIPETDPPAPDNPGPAWTQLFNERGTPAAGDPMDGTLTLVDASTGEYNYVCANTIPATTNVIRIVVRARWRETINGVRIVFANPVNAHYDFLQSAPGNRLPSSGADMVTTAACETCHGARIGDVGHGGGYTQYTTCIECHNKNFMATRDPEADFAFMIHRIHDAGVFTELGDFSEVTYPQHIYTCSKCHDGPEAGLAYTNPTRHNCGSCHDGVDFTLPAGTPGAHSGGAQLDDDNCTICHSEGGFGQGPIEAHMPIPSGLINASNVPEFNVTIDMTPPANGTHYVAGETPIVTVTLADSITNTPVAGTVYTADQDTEAPGTGEGLSTANLFVYGPRNEAVPVLTTNSTTDPAWDPLTSPTQAHPLFVNELVAGVPTLNDDPQVITDATGYKYQLMDNIGDLEPGTYMVRFEGADYGAVSDADYVTSSSLFMTFQVGTANEEKKVSGDACADCHGATIMHLEGSHPHYVPFDTDGCLGCHDKSGNYADYIGNRVHAVHRASATGDLHLTAGLPRDWSEVTFPRPANNCITCHTDTTTDTPVWRTPDEVVCGGCHGAFPSATPALFPNVDPDRIIREAGAAQHMEQNGGDFDPTTPPTLSCLICHGEGRIADLFVTHRLITFRPVPVDPNE